MMSSWARFGLSWRRRIVVPTLFLLFSGLSACGSASSSEESPGPEFESAPTTDVSPDVSTDPAVSPVATSDDTQILEPSDIEPHLNADPWPPTSREMAAFCEGPFRSIIEKHLEEFEHSGFIQPSFELETRSSFRPDFDKPMFSSCAVTGGTGSGLSFTLGSNPSHDWTKDVDIVGRLGEVSSYDSFVDYLPLNDISYVDIWVRLNEDLSSLSYSGAWHFGRPGQLGRVWISSLAQGGAVPLPEMVEVVKEIAAAGQLAVHSDNDQGEAASSSATALVAPTNFQCAYRDILYGSASPRPVGQSTDWTWDDQSSGEATYRVNTWAGWFDLGPDVESVSLNQNEYRYDSLLSLEVVAEDGEVLRVPSPECVEAEGVVFP